MKIIYAEPSSSAERALDDVVARIYQFGIQKQLFHEAETASELLVQTPKIANVAALLTPVHQRKYELGERWKQFSNSHDEVSISEASLS